jgi:outer membrane protein assembly factor BamB
MFGDSRLRGPAPAQLDPALTREPAPPVVLVPPPASPMPAAPSTQPGAPGTTHGGDAVALPKRSWSFRSAAPITGAPAVTDAGLVYVSTVEGYLHALGADGALRWSYGLDGVPLGAPALDPGGHVYVATSARRLYAIRPDGQLHWRKSWPTRIATAPVWSPSGGLYFAGRDRHLYALAAWGGALWDRQLGASAAAAPTGSEGGWLAVGTMLPELWLFRGGSLVSQLPLPGPLSQPVLASGDHWFVVARGELLALDAKDETIAWRGSARHAALSGNGRSLIAEVERELLWLSPRTGEELHRVGLPGQLSEAPTLSNSGMAFLPMISGDLLFLEPHSGAHARVKVAPGPLWAPIWDEGTETVTVAAGSGTVSSFHLRGWPGTEAHEAQREGSLGSEVLSGGLSGPPLPSAAIAGGGA